MSTIDSIYYYSTVCSDISTHAVTMQALRKAEAALAKAKAKAKAEANDLVVYLRIYFNVCSDISHML